MDCFINLYKESYPISIKAKLQAQQNIITFLN